MHILSMKNLDSVGWWEFRRVTYNLILVPFLAGSLWLGAFLVSQTSLRNMPVEPLGLVFMAGIFLGLANVAYTIGWLTEILWSNGETDLTRPYRWRMWILGTVLSVVLAWLPAALGILIFLLHQFH
ncbi:hypothetical protein [Asticcacaulis benevestitus]|uniref:Uncharacterized protein n=1 Tax=Asticcacaulis benevestitus DSM 16100 = ATCC BAA-896 TaxID=1121022 RepID=V4RD72_9CAUL|nr:hypothetical protein [Asticcacaulis benevestitus]ESQ89353.1 hypothetical protein ABENE_14290 [Asticcacaulis benevestitus DSM 16100 = ATCC BAA-896]